MLDLIKKANAYIDDAQHVWVSEKRLQEVADQLAVQVPQTVLPTWDGPAFLQTDHVATISQYFFVGNAINYKFWKVGVMDRYSYGGLLGSEGMWRCLADHPELLDANVLSDLTIEQLEVIFGDLPLLEHRWQALREVGTVLCKRYAGHILPFLQQYCFDVEVLIPAIITEFPTWCDIQAGLLFAKRAQLFLAMLYGRIKPLFQHIESMTLFADYHLPHILHEFGILYYSEELEQMIEQQQLIEKNSRFEIELRACTVVVGNRLLQALTLRGIQTNAILLDAILWSCARSLKKGVHHLTITTSY